MSIQVNDRLVWPGGKKKAFTLSFDDGVEQDIKLLEILNCYGVKCTFNLNPGLFGAKGTVAAGGREVSHNKLDAAAIRRTYEGHEIAGHGMYHVRMDGMDSARAVKEILDCRTALETLSGRTVTGYAYAFGAYDETVLKAIDLCGITYARTIDATYSFEIPTDFHRWNPTCHYRDDKVFAMADDFLSDDPRRVFRHTKLFYVWGHSYELEQHDDWARMEQLIQKIATSRDVWFAANGEIQEYVRAFRRLVFTADGMKVYNPSAIPVCIGGSFVSEYVEAGPGETVALIPPRIV